MSNSIGVTFNFLSSKYFRNNLAMSQTPFTIKLGKFSRNNKPPVAPAKCGEEARLYFTQLFIPLVHIIKGRNWVLQADQQELLSSYHYEPQTSREQASRSSNGKMHKPQKLLNFHLQKD